MKLIVLIVGLVVGFGGGLWYGVRHPEWAQDRAKQIDQAVLEAKIKLMQETKVKIDQAISSQRSAPAVPGSSFAPGAPGGKPDPAMVALRDQQERELAEMQKQLEAVKAK